MSTHQVAIQNRHGLKLAIQVDTPELPTGLAFIAHGQGGFMKQRHIETFAEAFLENNFIAVRFDATHSIGESEGDILDVTYDSYVEDLEDVINWARTQNWFMQPFALCGHSMGAQSTAWYAEQHPEEVSCLLPMAPTVNYELYVSTMDPGNKKDWQEKGYTELNSRSKPGVKKKIGWGVVESLKNYNLLDNANQLTMPVLIIVGELDQPCPPKHQQIFIDRIASKNKKLVQLKGLDHNYRDNKTGQYDENLEEVKQEIKVWLKSI